MKTKPRKPQTQRIAELLERGRTITQPQASDMGIGRLSARVEFLRNRRGMNIDTHMVKTVTGARIAKYKLA